LRSRPFKACFSQVLKSCLFEASSNLEVPERGLWDAGAEPGEGLGSAVAVEKLACVPGCGSVGLLGLG